MNNGHFLKSIIGDFWSIAQNHNAQFLEHNSLMPKLWLSRELDNSATICRRFTQLKHHVQHVGNSVKVNLPSRQVKLL